jgi:predicted amidohydrolase
MRSLALRALALVLAGCGSASEPASSRLPATTLKVGAVQYGGGPGAVDPGCSTDTCAIQKLVAEAAAQGALLVVAPEYGLDQKYLEPAPKIGDQPAKGGTAGALTKLFAKQAEELKVHIVIDLQTSVGTGSALKKHNSQLAFGPDGSVVGVHHKFELFASEAASLTPGVDVSVFDTPLGKVGLLICADVYGDLRLHDKLARELGARVVAVSSLWTAPGAAQWQLHFAKNWGVYVVSSNTTDGVGRGGGVFGPDGKPLVLYEKAAAAVTVAAIPAP